MVTDVEPYPSEMPKLHHAYSELTKRFANTKMDDGSMDLFHRAASELFGAAGFTIDVAWDEVRMGGMSTGMYMPEVTITGRTTHETEIDHDRLKHEIRAGMADGKVGVVDPNTGEWKEEPKKKLIT
jgi:hypothetical protein